MGDARVTAGMGQDGGDWCDIMMSHFPSDSMMVRWVNFHPSRWGDRTDIEFHNRQAIRTDG